MAFVSRATDVWQLEWVHFLLMWVGMQSKGSTLKIDSSLGARGGTGNCSPRVYSASSLACLLGVKLSHS
eukprot:10944371-Prorocentrum_lima.AAC.1